MTGHELLMLTLAQESTQEKGASWLETVQSGGLVGYIIIGLSIGALALIVMHLLQIRRNALIPTEDIEQIEARLERNDVAGALDYCLDPDNDSYFTRILASGLTRFQKSRAPATSLRSSLALIAGPTCLR